jgi:hypothetical protein
MPSHRGSRIAARTNPTLIARVMVLIVPVWAAGLWAAPQNLVDFNGDARTDYAVARGVDTVNPVTWFWLNPAGFGGAVWGFGTDFTVPADFDGDGQTDIAAWRPEPVGTFYIRSSATGTARIEPFGQGGDDPAAVGDYDGDGKADTAVYREGATPGSASFFFYRGSFDNPAGIITFIPWGTSGDFAVAGDYDGDDRFDPAVRRDIGGTGVYFLRLSTGGFSAIPWGLSTDIPVSGDFDGDGKMDLAVMRDEGGVGQWHIRRSTDGGHTSHSFGLSSSDFPATGDYDGDARTDVAIYRVAPLPGACVFWVLRSSDGLVTGFPFGLPGDFPLTSYRFK